jgi:hypothetical protein
MGAQAIGWLRSAEAFQRRDAALVLPQSFLKSFDDDLLRIAVQAADHYVVDGAKIVAEGRQRLYQINQGVGCFTFARRRRQSAFGTRSHQPLSLPGPLRVRLGVGVKFSAHGRQPTIKRPSKLPFS